MTHDGTVTYKIIGGDHKEYGPAPAEEVRQWILEGRASGGTLVQVVGSGEWKTLSTFAEFGEELEAQVQQFGNVPAQPGSSPPYTPDIISPAGEASLSVGRCLAGSARLFSANFGLIAGACMLMWLLSVSCQFIPFVGPVLYWFLQGVLYGGLYTVFLRRIRGEPAGMGDVFAGFGPQFMQLSLLGFLVMLLSSIGFVVCFLPGLYLTVAWSFAIPAAADKKLEFWTAMELSRRVTTRVWFKVAVLLLLAFLPVLLMHIYTQVKVFSTVYPLFDQAFGGSLPDATKLQELLQEVARVSVPLVLLGKVVLLFTLPFATGAVAYAYEDLFGTGAPRKD